jgi:hypothetical protein
VSEQAMATAMAAAATAKIAFRPPLPRDSMSPSPKYVE